MITFYTFECSINNDKPVELQMRVTFYMRHLKPFQHQLRFHFVGEQSAVFLRRIHKIRMLRHHSMLFHEL